MSGLLWRRKDPRRRCCAEDGEPERVTGNGIRRVVGMDASAMNSEVAMTPTSAKDSGRSGSVNRANAGRTAAKTANAIN